jgi:hypothetical protein
MRRFWWAGWLIGSLFADLALLRKRWKTIAAVCAVLSAKKRRLFK